MLAALATLAVVATTARASPLPVPVCMLYIDGVTNKFNFGPISPDGSVSSLVELGNWSEVGNGIDAGYDNTTFFAQPEVVTGGAGSSGMLRRRRRGKYDVDMLKADRTIGITSSSSSSAAGSAAFVATVKINSARTGASVNYATLGPVPGHAGSGTALADLSLDSTRSTMVGTVESTSGAFLFVLCDVTPMDGTVDKVWRDITSDWESWAFMKYGVSAYEEKNQVSE
jgi:hypothetical protein